MTRTPTKNSTQIRDGNGWHKGFVEQVVGGKVYISVVFSWDLEKAISRMVDLISQGKEVLLGGPAAEYAECSTGVFPKALEWHNPDAARTSFGCPFDCGFCLVHKVEGDLRELPASEWEPKPVYIDANLTACSQKHFDLVIDRSKSLPYVDINQGISAVLLTDYQASRLAELKLTKVRLAWDTIEYESKFMRGWDRLRRAGFPRSMISVYVLIGYHDTPSDALYRLELVRRLGGQPFPMRYQPLDAKKRNSYVGENWTHNELVRFCRYWANLRVTNKVPFADFQYPVSVEGRQ